MPNEYDSLVSDYMGSKAPGEPIVPAQMRASMAEAIDVNPDAVAADRAVAAKTGVPVDTVVAFPSEMKKKAALNSIDFDSYAKLYPNTAALLGNNDFAKVAHDDMQTLGNLESQYGTLSNIQGPKPTFGSVLTGLGQSFVTGGELTKQGINAQFADLFGDEKLAAEAVRKASQARFEQTLVDPNFQGETSRALYGGGTSLIQMVPGVAGSIVARNPWIALGVAGGQQETEAYTRYRERGATPNQALLGATLEGGIEVGTEKLPMGFLVDKFGKIGAKKFIAEYLGRELVGEEAATIAQNAVDTAIANPDKTWEQYRAELPDAMYQTAVGTLVASSAFAGAHKIAYHGSPEQARDKEMAAFTRSQEQIAAAKAAEANAIVLENINQQAAESKLRARDPVAFKQFVDKTTADSPVQDVYISAEGLAQSGVNPAELAKISPSVAAQLDTAVNTGVDIRIPLSEYTTNIAGTDFGQAMVDHIKTDPSGMSRAEGKEFMQSAGDAFKADVEKVLTEKQGDETFNLSRQVVENNILGQLQETKRFTDDVNKVYAGFMSNFYAVQAARLGITPEEMFAKHPIKIQADRITGAQLDSLKGPMGTLLAQDKVPNISMETNDAELDSYFPKATEKVDNMAIRKEVPNMESIKSSFNNYEVLKGVREIPFSFFSGPDAQTPRTKKLGEEIQESNEINPLIVAVDKDGPYILEGAHRYDALQHIGKKSFPAIVVLDLDNLPAKNSELNQGDNNGQRGAYNPQESVLTLLKTADLSTFLHESGHFFLEVMNKIALENTSPEIAADMDATLKWFGVPDLKTWNSFTLDQQREYHEKFARGFEAYLFEGVAPSVGMRGVFQRFRAWMLNVYRSIQDLNVELSPEIRGVFDRMLATSEQIKEAESLRQFTPYFASMQEAGMNEDEWREYQNLGKQASQDAVSELETRSLKNMQWLQNARSKELKKLQSAAAKKRKAVKAEVTAEVMAEPENRARTFLSKGELNGNKVEGPHKMDIDALKKMYGEEEGAPWKELDSKFGKFGIMGKDGLHPDVVAEMFGFTSGDEMIQKMLAAENPKEKIAGITDQRMLERYGDLTSPDVLNKAVSEAIHNRVREKFLATEVNALQKATGGRKILTEAAKNFAENIINRTKIRDLKPTQYESAEIRAAKASALLFKEGNTAEAAVQKRNQLIHFYATRATYDAQEMVEKGIRYLQKFGREGTRKNIDTSYLDQIDSLLERFDLRKGTTLRSIDKNKSLVEWVKAQEELGLEPDLPESMLNEANRKSYKEMTVEEMKGLIDTVKQIEHIGRLKEKLLTLQDERKFGQVVDQLTASITKEAGDKPLVDNRTRASELARKVQMFKGFFAAHRKVASLVKEMDGFKDGGPFWDVFTRTMNHAGNTETTMRAEATRKLMELVRPILKGERMGGKGKYFESVGKSFNREERIGIALNMGNLGNMQRLLDGEGWQLKQIRPVLDSLSKEDWKFVQDIWDFFESYRPEIGAKEKRIYGKEPEWVEPHPVTTPFGELRGGYYPIKYDARRSIAAEQHSDAEAAKQQMKGAYTSATTRRSFTKSRADEVKGRPLLYSMDGLYSGVNEIIHDLAWHEWLIDANRLMKNKALDGVIRSRYGADVVKQFKSGIQDIATGEMPSGDPLEKVLGNLRAGATIAGLGFNVMNSVINLTGLTQTMVRIGPRYFASGMAEWAKSPVQLVKTIHEKSPMMKNRAATLNREINEIQSLVRGKTKARQIVDRMMFAPMEVTQLAVDTPTWWGAYLKAQTEGFDESKAIAQADQAVIDAQGSGMVKDLAAIQRGGPIKKLFTTFYSYFSTTYNLSVEKTKATNFKDAASIMKLGGNYLMLYSVPAVLGTLLKAALVGGGDDEDDLTNTLINDQISYLLGTVIGAREVTGAIQTVAGVSQYNTGYQGPAGLRFFQEFYKLAKQVDQGEADEAFRRSAVNVLGIILHLPSSQANRTIDGIAALSEGDTDNPLAPLVGAPPKN